MYIGHGFLKKEFGVTPKVGWMLDTFGHSAANAALFSDFGFEALFIARADIELRE
jgi:alpha-mannosidase